MQTRVIFNSTRRKFQAIGVPFLQPACCYFKDCRSCAHCATQRRKLRYTSTAPVLVSLSRCVVSSLAQLTPFDNTHQPAQQQARAYTSSIALVENHKSQGLSPEPFDPRVVSDCTGLHCLRIKKLKACNHSWT